MITKKATIDGKEHTFACSALLPKLYRVKFGSDMVSDMRRLINAYKNTDGDAEKMLEAFDGEVFERLTWLMLRHAGEDVPDNMDEWLASLDTIFSIYEALPTVIDLWYANNKTTSKPRKK